MHALGCAKQSARNTVDVYSATNRRDLARPETQPNGQCTTVSKPCKVRGGSQPLNQRQASHTSGFGAERFVGFGKAEAPPRATLSRPILVPLLSLHSKFSIDIDTTQKKSNKRSMTTKWSKVHKGKKEGTPPDKKKQPAKVHSWMALSVSSSTAHIAFG